MSYNNTLDQFLATDGTLFGIYIPGPYYLLIIVVVSLVMLGGQVILLRNNKFSISTNTLAVIFVVTKTFVDVVTQLFALFFPTPVLGVIVAVTLTSIAFNVVVANSMLWRNRSQERSSVHASDQLMAALGLPPRAADGDGDGDGDDEMVAGLAGRRTRSTRYAPMQSRVRRTAGGCCRRRSGAPSCTWHLQADTRARLAGNVPTPVGAPDAYSGARVVSRTAYTDIADVPIAQLARTPNARVLVTVLQLRPDDEEVAVGSGDGHAASSAHVRAGAGAAQLRVLR